MPSRAARISHVASDWLVTREVEPPQPFWKAWIESLASWLKSLHEPVDQWLGQLPMSVAVACAMALFVVAMVWVWTLRKEFVFRGAPDRQWWRDLRVWATIVLLPYMAVYLWLGR